MSDHQLPDVRVVPAHLSAEDLTPVVIMTGGASLVLPMWEVRKVLSAVRRERRNRMRQVSKSEFPTEHSSSAVQAAALHRAEVGLCGLLDLPVVP